MLLFTCFIIKGGDKSHLAVQSKDSCQVLHSQRMVVSEHLMWLAKAV